MSDLMLSGRTILVTGAARGLGLVLAEALRGCGARLVLADRDAEAGAAAAERGPGREAAPLPRDRHRHGASRHRCASLGSPEHFLAQLPAKKLTEQAMSLSRRPSLRSCTVEFLKFADSC